MKMLMGALIVCGLAGCVGLTDDTRTWYSTRGGTQQDFVEARNTCTQDPRSGGLRTDGSYAQSFSGCMGAHGWIYVP